MTQLIRLVCPKDDLPYDVSFLDDWSAEMATWQVGDSNSIHTDATIACANGHQWALNFRVTFTREA
jgi:hypothetical protein